MHIFRNRKSPKNRSAEHLPAAPPDDRRYSQFEYDQKQVPNQKLQPVQPVQPVQPLQPVQPHSSQLSRSQSQRQSTLRDRPTVNIVDERRDPSARTSIERSVSFRGKTISNPISQPTSPRVSHPEPLNETDEFPHSFAENPSPVTAQSFEPRAASLASQRGPRPSHPAHDQIKVKPYPLTPIRVDSERDIPASPYQETLQDPVLNLRPPSQQSRESLSPLQSHPDMQFQTPSQQIQDKSTGSPQDRSRRGSVSNNMPENGRSTPTPRREDSGEIDVRALVQKHDELQAKYSKVKRYYFEKDAQVQHLQNTVAHQRMAVSRTVLDDNEYTNRFQRLDGAIKDLAFSVRKDWRSIPPWLHGMVTDDAQTVGTKEMTAVGRAVISRWLVEEVFQRHFHPSLDATFSIQLKAVEMNLRRQRPSSDEDRENASSRLSYWRRTTFDGLSDALVGPDADEHRGSLVEHLIVELAGFMGSQLHDNAHPGLEASVRMIIENSINIIEKIPLEARDVCVDYFPPGVPLSDQYMKVEGQLPALSHPPPANDEEDEPVETPARPRRSFIGALMGSRKPAVTSTSETRPVEEKAETESNPRIRFAAFLAVEVRGKGPATVLVKAPVWLVE